MKKSLVVAIVVGLALSALAQTAPQTTAPASGQPAQPAAPAPYAPAASAQAAPAQPTQAAQPCRPVAKKEIKDPGEYNAYTTSLNAADAGARIQGFESFVRQYPNSAYKGDALEQLMTAYQQAGNAAKMADAARQLLQVDPNNVRALALLSYLARASAGQPGALQQSVADARTYGEKGLQALNAMPCPEGASPADVEKLQKQTAVIFHGSVGFAALQNKDYTTAQQNFHAAVDAEPPTAQDSLQDVYSLALAYLEPKPLNPAGLWYIARAVVLSNNNVQIANYGRSKYIKYHGGDDGWDQVLAQAKAATSNASPQSLAITPAPSPAEQAAKLASTVDPKKMDFGQWELILTAGDPATQQKVWAQIKGIEVPFAALVIESTKTRLSLAATADAIEAKHADVTVTMTGPIPATLMPKVAAGQEVQLIAKPDSYTPNPFMMQMTEGQLIAKKEPPKTTPRKGTTTHKKPAAH